MIRVNGTDINVVHVRHDGRSHEIFSEDLRLDGDIAQVDLINAIENNLDLVAGALAGYELDIVAASNTAIVRPVAKFGG